MAQGGNMDSHGTDGIKQHGTLISVEGLSIHRDLKFVRHSAVYIIRPPAESASALPGQKGIDQAAGS
jgi:hypothetical protein